MAVSILDALFQPEQYAPGAEQMALLQRLLPMLQQVTPGPGFGPTEASAQSMPPVPMPLPRPQAAPAGPPMPISQLMPGIDEIMQSQGTTRPLPYPMAGGGPPSSAAMPAPGRTPPPASAAPAPQSSGMPLSLGGMGGGLGGALPMLLGVAQGALAGAISPQTAAASMGKMTEQRQKLQQQTMAYQLLVSQGVTPQAAMLAVMAPEAGKAAGVLGGSNQTEDIKNYEVAKKGGFKGSFMDYLAAKRAGAGEYGLQPVWGSDAQGNPAILQLGKGGEAIQSKLPQGVQLRGKEAIKLDAGTHWILLDPLTRQQVGMIPKDIAGKEKAEEIGKSQGQASQIIPQVETTVNNAIGTIDKLRRHPGLDAGTGLTGTVARQIAGTEAYNFGALNKQAMGQSFMAAREALKGAGQVTDFEGMKGEQAIANLDAAQSKKQYLEALDNLERMMKASLADLKRKAGQQPAADDGDGWTTLPNGVRIREKR